VPDREKLLLLATETVERFGDDNCSQMAAAITYYVLFAIVPLTMFLVSVTSVALPDDARVSATEWIEDYLNVTPEDVTLVLDATAAVSIEARYGPDAFAEIEEELNEVNTSDARMEERRAIAEMVEAGEPVSVGAYELEANEIEVQSASFISEIMDQVSNAAVPLGIFGFVVMAFSASIAFSAIRRSLNFVWNVPHRPFAQQRVMEISMLVGLVLLLGASVTVTAIAQILRDATDGTQNFLASADALVWLAFGYLLPWSFTFVLIILAYRYVPNAPSNSLRYVWLGALLASGAIEVLKYGYGVYVANFANYGAAYGALGGVLLFMFFVWLSSYIFLMGAELSSTYPKVMGGEIKPEPDTTSRGLVETVRRGIVGLFVEHEPPRRD